MMMHRTKQIKCRQPQTVVMDVKVADEEQRFKRQLHLAAFDIRRRILAAELCNIGACLHDMRRYDQAVDVYNESLQSMMSAIKSRTTYEEGEERDIDEVEFHAEQSTEEEEEKRWRAILHWGKSIISDETSLLSFEESKRGRHSSPSDDVGTDENDTKFNVPDFYHGGEIQGRNHLFSTRCVPDGSFTDPMRIDPYAFGREDTGSFGTAVGSATLLYNMGLLHHRKGAEAAASLVDIGNDGRNQLDRAMQLFQWALTTLLDADDDATGATDDEEEESEGHRRRNIPLLTSLLNNIAQVHMRLGRDSDALETLGSALELVRGSMTSNDDDDDESDDVYYYDDDDESSMDLRDSRSCRHHDENRPFLHSNSHSSSFSSLSSHVATFPGQEVRAQCPLDCSSTQSNLDNNTDESVFFFNTTRKIKSQKQQSQQDSTMINRLAIITLNEIGRIHLRRNELDHALVATRDTLLLRRTVHGDDHIDTAVSLYNLGLIYQAMKDFDQARHHFLEFTRLISSRKASPCSMSQGTYSQEEEEAERCKFVISALIHVLLIDCSQDPQEYSSDDLREFQLSLRTVQSYRERCSWTHPNLIDYLNTIGSCLYRQEQYGMAVAFYTECLRVIRCNFPEHHYRLSIVLNNIGRTLHRAGELTRAKESFEAAVNVRRSLLSPAAATAGPDECGETSSEVTRRRPERSPQIYDHPIYARILYNMGLVLSDMDRHNDAVQSIHLSVKLAVKLALQLDSNDEDEYHQSYATGRNTRKDDEKSDLAATLHDAGAMLSSEYGQLSISMHALTESLQLRVEVYGTEHMCVAECLKTLGRILRDEGKYDEAMESLSESVRIERRVMMEHAKRQRSRSSNRSSSLLVEDTNMEMDRIKAELASTLSVVGQLHDLRGDSDEALACFHEALDILRVLQSSHLSNTYHPGDHDGEELSMSVLLNAIGTIHHERGETNRAMLAFAEALAVSDGDYGLGGSGLSAVRTNGDVDWVLDDEACYPPCAAAA